MSASHSELGQLLLDASAYVHLGQVLLEPRSSRRQTPERITIFTDAQAAIRRLASEEPGPGQQYALQSRKHIAALRRARPGIIIEIRWCPAHKGVEGNEKADEWAKVAAEEPDTRGMEWLNYSDRTEERQMPLPRSLANLKREISEKKWVEARRWAGGRASRKKCKMPESHKPDGTIAENTKRLASKYYQLKTGHARTGQYLHWAKVRPTAQCWWCQCPSQTRDHLFKVCPERKMQQKILWAEVQKETGRWKSRWTVRDLLADGRCGQAVLDFLSSTDVVGWYRRWKGDARSEVSEWELRERREREGEQEAEAEGLGAAGIGSRRGAAAVPAHGLIRGIGSRGVGRWARFLLLFPLWFPLCAPIFSGQAWAEGKGELATCRHRADSGREKWIKCTPPQSR